MKRGIILNLIIVLFLLFLLLLPVILMFAADQVAQANQCVQEYDGWGEGICRDMYTLTVASGYIGIGTSALMAGVLGLYLVGVLVFFLVSFAINRKKGQPVSPVAKGMLLSSIAMVVSVGCIVALLFTFA